jgi:protein-S-isoprenylcysteine O-methyltransferase Ste14
VPRWVAFLLGAVVCLFVFPLVHGAIPWALSLTTVRHGWNDGKPGAWNLLGLAAVVAGAALVYWTLLSMLSRIPKLPKRVRLETTSQILITNGPFAFSRNPMFVGAMILWLGWIVLYGSIAVALGLAVIVVIANVATRREERALESRFGDAYRQYKRRVPRWVGRIHGEG